MQHYDINLSAVLHMDPRRLYAPSDLRRLRSSLAPPQDTLNLYLVMPIMLIGIYHSDAQMRRDFASKRHLRIHSDELEQQQQVCRRHPAMVPAQASAKPCPRTSRPDSFCRRPRRSVRR